MTALTPTTDPAPRVVAQGASRLVSATTRGMPLWVPGATLVVFFCLVGTVMTHRKKTAL